MSAQNDPTNPTAPTNPGDEHASDHPDAMEGAPDDSAPEPALPPAPATPEARETLAWCAANPTDDDAIVRLNDLREALLRPELAQDVITAAELVAAPIIADASPRPAQHAHMTIMFASLLELTGRARDRVDTLFAMWMRNEASWGGGHATPPVFQRPEFVQRVADMLGWGTLDVARDREALGRFLDWVNSWAPRQGYRARRTLVMLRRNFPAPDLWKRVRYAQ